MSYTLNQSIKNSNEKNTVVPELAAIKAELDSYFKKLSINADDEAIDKVITLFQKRIISNEKDIWQTLPTHKSISQYQNSYKALEQLYNLRSSDERYNFKIVIPVADRPQHLKHCLDSLITLCQSYEYGGYKNNQYTKISVLIADDSKEPDNIELHRAYCTVLTKQGLDIDYFGLEEQFKLVSNINQQQHGLQQIISSATNIDNFSHKGASVMRNITYLKLRQDITDKNTLIYFIDSDQEFCITTASPDSDSDNKYYAVNYFHYLNSIFSNQDIAVLTGKVVGDPPVSPSVMAGNFQQDIKNFLSSIEKLKANVNCQFHKKDSDHHDDAAYHDMANLFGFINNNQAFNYQCTLQGTHNNADCFIDFSDKLSNFFYGEHPTRKTYFNYENGFLETSPARTVYTGNYVIKAEALDYFIPFATLKLRMAGPVLGRILKTRLKHRFVSANLPMLHNRTIESIGRSEYRAGVSDTNKNIDLGNEFIRQFYGDVMLFSMEEINKKSTKLNKTELQAIFNKTYLTIKDNYIEKHNTILLLKSQIEKQLSIKNQWWNTCSTGRKELDIALTNFNLFLNNIQSNFDNNANAFRQITTTELVEKQLDIILQAVLDYQDNMTCWQAALNMISLKH